VIFCDFFVLFVENLFLGILELKNGIKKNERRFGKGT